MNSFEKNKRNTANKSIVNVRCGLTTLLLLWILVAIGSMVFLVSKPSNPAPKSNVQEIQNIEHSKESKERRQLIKTATSLINKELDTQVQDQTKKLNNVQENNENKFRKEEELIDFTTKPLSKDTISSKNKENLQLVVDWSDKDHGPPPDHPALVGSTWPPPNPRQLAQRRADPNDKFPPKQPESMCAARGLSGGSYDANKQILDHIDVTPDNSDGHTIMCIIYTIEKNHASAKTCRDTWASHCDGFLTMSNAQDDSIPAAHVTHEGPEEYNNIWQKVRSIWKYVSLSYSNEFDWFMMGGDDLFIIPSNLRAYLNSDQIKKASGFPENNIPLFLGRRFQIPNGGQLFNSGGAGYILNKAALKILNDNLDNPLCKPHQKVFAEDVNVAACLSKFGIIPYDTRDFEESLSTTTTAMQAEGGNGGKGSQDNRINLRERFHPFTPGQHFTWQPPKKKKPDGSTADWYDNYNRPWGVGQGKECCSRLSASFHYVKANLMPHLYALLYDCRS
mmetsp:Transcript_48252/g.61900  ORF Transcript_48252/g.61900 Transcript_48252/m.61900 type:complete len:506 (+) Transcript_48252:109-1626(+)